jgi:hypothetical protein
VKNHDFTPKNHIFPILRGAREIFGVFHVKNHDFTPKKIIFLPILGGARAGCPPPESAPALGHIVLILSQEVFALSPYTGTVCINSCGRSQHSEWSLFDHGYLEEEKSMIHSFTITFGAK